MKHTITILTLLLSFILFSNCNTNTKEDNIIVQEENDDRIILSKKQFESNNMILGSITKKDVPQTISVNGMIDVPPENKAVVNSVMGGFIRSITLLEGDKVTKGQALATVENPEFISLQQAYLEIKEQITYLEAEYKRQQTLLEEDITSQKSFLKAESQFKTALAKFNGLRKQLALLNISIKRVERGEITSVITIFAPISGVITNIHVTKGTYVSPTESILEIVDNSHIHLDLAVFEKDILNIKKGQDIRFKIPETSNETYDAKVHLVGKSISEERTITVHAHPNDENADFLTGMFVTADIIINESSVWVLPETAIVEVDSDHYILILDELKDNAYYFRQVRVDIGNTVDGFTELIIGDRLTESEEILIKGAFGLL